MTQKTKAPVACDPGARQDSNGGGEATVDVNDFTTFTRYHSTALPCYRCGSIAHHRIEAGTGPHGSKLICRNCGGFIKWLSQRSPEERTAQAAHYQRQHMATLPPTEKQLRALKNLVHKGSKPTNRLEAHDAIDVLLKQREGVR